MTRTLAAFIGSAALLAAAPASAGPCEQLAGGRWLFHVEGGVPARIETGVLDFRDGAPSESAQRGSVFYAAGLTPLPANVDGVALPYGGSASGRYVGCTAQPGNVARLRHAVNMDLTVAADGRTAVTAGNTGGQGAMTGWAVREPASPARPVGPVAQRPRN